MSTRTRAVLAALGVLLVMSGCTTPSDKDGGPTSSSPTTTSTVTPTPTAAPTPTQPRPRAGQCHRLSLAQAVAPTTGSKPVKCRRPHTAETFFVGRLDLTSSGQSVTVDSAAAQAQPATACPRRAASHLQISPAQLRLTMARAVWFTPSVADGDAGAAWFRCDLVVVAGPGVLMRLPERTAGRGDLPAIAMCATAEPGTAGFDRVACARKHSWEAVASVDLGGPKFPPADEVSARMEPACRAAARARAADPLEFRWSEERPTRQQWGAGQHYGICWIPA